MRDLSRKPWLAACVCVLALFSTLSGVRAAAGPGPMEVLVLVPPGTFHVGDTVTLTVLVYDLATPADPANLTVSLPNNVLIRNLTYARQSVGVYAVSYPIQRGDVPSASSQGVAGVTVLANATSGGVSAFGYGSVPVWTALPPLEVTLSATATWIEPGANATITATVRYGGTPTDADAIWVNESEAFPLGGSTAQSPLPLTHAGTGTYAGVFHAAQATPEGTAVSFTALASLGNATDYSGLGIGIGPAPTFTIWEHIRLITPNYTLLDIDVSNATGWPVEGADVALYTANWQCSGYPCQPPPYGFATTDRLGSASFNVTYPYHPMTVFMIFLGYVRLGVLNQTFVGHIFSRSLYPSYRDLCPSGGLISYAPGVVVHRIYHGACGYFWANRTYEYYAHTAQSLVATGSVQADAAGDFNLTFTAPATDLYVEIRQNVTGLGWVEYHDVVFVADPSRVEIANLSIGRVAQIAVDMTGVPGSVALELVNATDIAYPESVYWFPLSCCTSLYTIPAVPGAPFRANLVLPRFLPKDQDYLLTVGANYSLGAPYYGLNYGATYIYREIFHVTNKPPTAAATFSTLNPAQNEVLSVNASASTDPDGVVLSYRIDWGDGDSTGSVAAPNATHVYVNPGTYTVDVQVEDDSGARNGTLYTVVVEATILGLRASTFYVVTVVVAVAAVAAVAASVYLRKKRSQTGKPPQSP